jgi:[ribosomal protein S5]-alanine N-acetyltransferase
MTTPDTITSERLTLIPMTAEFLTASLARDAARAESLLGLAVPEVWYTETGLMRHRLGQLERDPALQPWLVRAIGLRANGQMIGHIGFHTAPGAEYLKERAPGGVEFGYTVFEPYRRQGYAREAAEALMQWARTAHGVERFVLSISPYNEASQRLAAGLGFKKVGSEVDEEDGLEEVYVLRVQGE